MSLIAQLLATISMAAFAHTGPVSVPIQDLEVAQKLSTDDDVTIRASFYYPNGCYEARRSVDRLGPSGEKVILKHEVIIRGDLCTMAVVYDQSRFYLEDIEEGQYELIDAYDSQELGVLIVDDKGSHRIDTY